MLVEKPFHWCLAKELWRGNTNKINYIVMKNLDIYRQGLVRTSQEPGTDRLCYKTFRCCYQMLAYCSKWRKNHSSDTMVTLLSNESMPAVAL